MSLTEIRHAASDLRALGVPRGRALDLARAGLDAAAGPGWVLVADELGVSEAASFRLLGFTPVQHSLAAGTGVNAFGCSAGAAPPDNRA